MATWSSWESGDAMDNGRRGITQRAGWLIAATWLLLVGTPSSAAPAARELRWQQLIPGDPADMSANQALRGVVQHGQAPAIDPVLATIAGNDPADEAQPPAPARAARRRGSADAVPALNGERVRMRGFVVPIGFDGTKVKEFLLVPYVGACIHVPPPPANQVVLIEAATPFDIGGLFEAVAVTGTLRIEASATELADVVYHLAAEQVESVGFER